MSALTNPSPTPIQPPQRVAPVTPAEPPKPGLPWKSFLVLAVIGAAAWSAYQFYYKPAQQAAAQKAAAVIYRTAKATVGPFERTIRVGGTTGARLFANLTAPRLRGFESRSQMELLKLVKNGAWVKKGDVIAEIDPGYLVDHVDDIKATIGQSELDVDKRVAEQGMELEALMQTLRVSKATVDKAGLDNKAAEVRTEVERELLKLAYEEAQAKYKQSELDVPERKLIHQAEIKILGFTKERHIRHRDRHANDIKAYTIFSPMEGMVVMSNTYRGGGESQQVQQGDQLNPGQPLAKIVNPQSMQVEGNINQAESTELRIGQRATIGLDAFPDIRLKGKVYSQGALATGGRTQSYYIRNIPVKLTIENVDPRIIPDLSAWADVVIEEQPKATLIPLNAINKEGDKNYVYIKQGQQWSKREVALGSANNTHAIVKSGVNEGDELRLQ
ncbi:MAG: HlyD family efflux transporter periplasmic adaptor subunit [Bryobacteraceae bacterium]